MKPQSGYLVDGTFRTYIHRDWESADETLPADVVATAEEREQYENEDYDREVLRTADGKIFLNGDTARAHAENLVIPELDAVMEQIEKLKIMCEVHKDKSPLLDTIKDALTQLSRDGGEAMMEKYHDSTC